MALKVTREDVWVGKIKDRVGGLAEKLVAVTDAGAKLKFVFARRAPDKPGTGVVFLSPLKGAAQIKAARKVGLRKSKHLHSVRVEGAYKPSRRAKFTRELAAHGINLRGFSAAVIGGRFVIHIALDSAAEAARTVRLLKGMA